MSDALILGFDTSAAHCAAALLSGDRCIAAAAEDMRQGQAERLFPLLESLLNEVGADWGDLSRIGVGVGPGNFTGIRISVSAARGLALSLGVPAIGVSTFEAIEAASDHLPAVRGPRDQVYLARPGCAPSLEIEAQVQQALAFPPTPAQLAQNIARRAALAVPGPAPAPLYVRAADAAPARDTAPAILT